MPFGIQGITACPLVGDKVVSGVSGSPMPFGIQGITAQPPQKFKPSSIASEVSNAFRHSGHHCPYTLHRGQPHLLSPSPMPFGIQGITAPTPSTLIHEDDMQPSPMPFGIQGITASAKDSGQKLWPSCLQCLSAFRASLPHESVLVFGRGRISLQCLSAFRASLPDKPALVILDEAQASLQCLSAFRASLPLWMGCALRGDADSLQCLSAFRASLPEEYSGEVIGEVIGLQCLSAFRASLPHRCPRWACLVCRHVSNAFRHSGHHCLRSIPPMLLPMSSGLQCLSAFRASLPRRKCCLCWI